MLGGRINVVEKEDELIFTNLGAFIPLNIENVIKENAPQETYRNPFLVTAMFNLKMVDTIGSGIRRMFNYQRIRFFPMPEYDFSDNRVKLTITGKVLDIDYARVLARHQNLTLEEIILLDKVQKKKKLKTEEITVLRERKLIEGRKPNFIISEQLAVKTKQVAKYLKTRGFDKEFYKKLVLELVKKNYTGTTKAEIREVLWDKLPDVLSNNQKETRISNILRELRAQKRIVNTGSDAKSNWISTS